MPQMTVDTIGRAIQLYRRTATSRSAVLLLAANAIPLVGVLFFGWSLWTILVLYWLENGIVGVWNIPKIVLAQGTFVPTIPDIPESAALAATGSGIRAAALRAALDQARQRQAAQVRITGSGGVAGAGRMALAAFFCFHYGMFWFVHGVFIFTLPLFMGAGGTCEPDPFGLSAGLTQECGSAFGGLNWTSIAIGGAALFLSHGASFLLNYIGRGEYVTATPSGQMGGVYGRVVILHLTIIFGAFAVGILGSPIWALVILVGLKTAFDLGLHLRERRSADARIPADTEFGRIVQGT